MGDYLNNAETTQAEACGYSIPGILESSNPVVYFFTKTKISLYKIV
jgi:hypothetical protein